MTSTGQPGNSTAACCRAEAVLERTYVAAAMIPSCTCPSHCSSVTSSAVAEMSEKMSPTSNEPLEDEWV